MMWWGHGGWGGGSWIAMTLVMLTFWGLIIGLIVWGVRSASDKFTQAGAGQSPAASPEDVLRDRFARGEIDEDEFTHRRALLRSP